MEVKLLSYTPDPIGVMWTAARTCYSEKSPIKIWINDRYPQMEEAQDGDLLCEYKGLREENMWNLVKKALDSGHLSVAEHASFTFAIEGISRACSHQLVRHRHCTFSQQSQRYVEFKGGTFDIDYPEAISNSQERIKIFDECIEKISKTYSTLIEDGVKAEDARAILPNATKTNLVMTLNFHELIHVCGLRLCTRAQKEIQDLFRLIVNCIKIKAEEDYQLACIVDYLVPQCEHNGFCKEHKSCGRKPTLEQVTPATKISFENLFYKNGKEYEVRKVENAVGEAYWIICEPGNPSVEYGSCSVEFHESPADMILWFLERED